MHWSVTLLCMVTALILVSALLSRLIRAPILFRKTADTKQSEPAWTLRPNGDFWGLEAFFSLDGQRLHVYTALETVLSDKTGKHELAPDHDELRPYWKGEPYYHESYDFVDGRWIRQTREFSRGADSNLEFGDCDDKGTLDLQIEREIAAELPSPIRVKAVLKFKEFAVVVYSDPSSQNHNYVLDVPPLEADLLVPDQGGWRIVDSQEVDEYGYSCGVNLPSMTLPGREAEKMLFILTFDPSVTSNYYNLKSFLISRAAIQPKTN